MRVAIFIDGKNFFEGWRDTSGGRDIDFRRLSPWVTRVAGGTHHVGSHYYTGVEATVPPTPSQERLEKFLDMLEEMPGFFVHRFDQRQRSQTCATCGHAHTFSQAKEVDTTMVSDMLRLAAGNAFEIAVLMSGDADLVPAVEGVRSLGRKVLVATWGSSGLSARIRKVAFDHIDLTAGLAEFGRQGFGYAATGAPTFAHGATSGPPPAFPAPAAPVTPLSNDPAVYEAAMVDELGKAQAAMPGGYIGAHFFVTRWRSAKLPEIPDFRRRILDRLQEQGRAEVYLTDDGVQAVRVK
ncbi:MAG: NYN domain-containing protein [Planctomycetia bacterium]|nr:NYN domain-containing protein [Planctomycetia bacterium]